MPNRFSTAFAASLPARESVTGEPWRFEGTEYPAVAIEELDTASSAIVGGKLGERTTEIIVRDEVYFASGVSDGKVVEVPSTDAGGGWKRLRVQGVNFPRDGSVHLLCGPAGIKRT